MANSSYIVNAAKAWADALAEPPLIGPKGLYNLGVHASLQNPYAEADNLYIYHWSSYEYDFEFTAEFSDSSAPDEGEVTLYNLTDDTIQNIRVGKIVGVSGGYGWGDQSDQGVWLFGWVTGCETEWKDADKLTTIYVRSTAGAGGQLEQQEAAETDLVAGGSRISLTYEAGVTAGFILQQLCDMTNIPIAEFTLKNDRPFSEAVTIEGDLHQKISEYASMCGVWAYEVNGLLYVKDMRMDTSRNSFLLNEASGLLDSPTPYTEEVKDTRTEDSEEKIVYTGYKVKMLLNHRITPGVGIELVSRDAHGQYTVKSGRHVYDGVGGYTEAIIIE
ncbi:hypothetical protein LJC49_04460 [Ruminococcaceae bacterium OttesenSCG-928-I18]|nr:hypothetical protein [Ruminococcaceae bacterium OttesenSCG-928-I18]